ncbi:MAG TPA: hypothetical protein VLS48_02440, partial [Anaerolineales bacterium]|nr:hypothetical protein [Anaerolineales bacterium]
MSLISLPTYSAQLFVNREREIQVFHDMLSQVIGADTTPMRRTLAFIGERGMGKTWLLQHLYAQAAKIDHVRRLWLDLDELRGMDPNLAVVQVLRAFGETILGSKEDFGASLTELSRAVMER